MTESSILTRRQAITAAAAGAATLTIAASTPPEAQAAARPDDAELVALVEERKRVRAQLEDARRREFNEMTRRGYGRWRIGPECRQLHARLCELDALILETPAQGPEGIAAKLSLVMPISDVANDSFCAPLRSAFADARRLAGLEAG